ncbi:YfgM family protein [Dickeya chrysanthemi]|uniref:Ancillary SecYEG translocon subunit n=1 Tax=Dickeya chrysanthemi TaxID=556 RepID=A0ABU8JJS5_DICCH|nr:YfgM family protein [Dickeya chrysanthemi]MBX9446117.1 YfgM family protein [Dickeya chrysanthemi]MCA7006274.1 YfgM family protein [Dickeya chrysanthemi]
MEVYTTENEQVEVIRRFFVENGKALAIGVVLGIGALVGWRFWQNHQESSAMAASAAYQQATEALSAGTPEGINSAEKFITGDHGNYGALASLALAHQFVEKNDIAKAEQQLRQALGQTKDGDLQAMINLRLARVLLQQKKPDEALKALDAIKLEGWVAMVADVRGDVLASKGDTQGARDAYNKGMAAKPAQGLQSLLRLKLNNLPS